MQCRPECHQASLRTLTDSLWEDVQAALALVSPAKDRSNEPDYIYRR